MRHRCGYNRHDVTIVAVRSRVSQARSARWTSADRKPVPLAADGPDRVIADLRPQPARAHAGDVGTRVEVVTPHRLQQLALCQRLARVLRQLLQHQELEPGERQRPWPMPASFGPGPDGSLKNSRSVSNACRAVRGVGRGQTETTVRPRTEGTNRHDHPDRRRRTQPGLLPRPARHPVAARLRRPGRDRVRGLDPDPGADPARLPARSRRREPAQQRPAGLDPGRHLPGVRRDDDRVRRRDAARAGRLAGRHLGAAADRGLRRRADGRGAAARRSGRRFRPGGARGKGGARQLARGRAPDLGEHRVHRPDRGVLRRGPLLQPGAAPWPGHLLARQRPGLPGRVRGRHHRVQLRRRRAAVLRRRARRLDLDHGDLRPPVPPGRRGRRSAAVDIDQGIQRKYNENRRKKCDT